MHAGDAAERRGRRQQRASGCHRGWLRLGPGPVHRGCRQDRHHPGAEGRLVLGYTTQYAAAATIAGIDALGRPESLQGKTVDGTYISSATGSGFAAPIWGDALKPLTAGQPYEDFVYPEGIEGVGVTAATPPAPPKPPKGNHGGGHGGGHGGR